MTNFEFRMFLGNIRDSSTAGTAALRVAQRGRHLSCQVRRKPGTRNPEPGILKSYTHREPKVYMVVRRIRMLATQSRRVVNGRGASRGSRCR